MAREDLPGRYPNNHLETKLRERGYMVQCMWQLRGPNNTDISWIECLQCQGRVILVQSFRSGGYLAYIPTINKDTEFLGFREIINQIHDEK